MLDSAIATAAASTLSLSLSLSLLSVDSSWGDWCFGSTADQQSRDAAHVLLRPGYEMLVSLQLLANGFHAPLLDNLARDAARTCVRDRKAKKAVYANDCHSHFSAPRAPEDLPAESTLAIAARILHDFFAEPKCNSPRLGETLARCRGNGNGGYPYWAASSNIRSHKKKKPTKKQQAYARKQQAGGRSERGTGEGARQSSGRAPGDYDGGAGGVGGGGGGEPPGGRDDGDDEPVDYRGPVRRRKNGRKQDEEDENEDEDEQLETDEPSGVTSDERPPQTFDFGLLGTSGPTSNPYRQPEDPLPPIDIQSVRGSSAFAGFDFGSFDAASMNGLSQGAPMNSELGAGAAERFADAIPGPRESGSLYGDRDVLKEDEEWGMPAESKPWTTKRGDTGLPLEDIPESGAAGATGIGAEQQHWDDIAQQRKAEDWKDDVASPDVEAAVTDQEVPEQRPPSQARSEEFQSAAESESSYDAPAGGIWGFLGVTQKKKKEKKSPSKKTTATTSTPKSKESPASSAKKSDVPGGFNADEQATPGSDDGMKKEEMASPGGSEQRKGPVPDAAGPPEAAKPMSRQGSEEIQDPFVGKNGKLPTKENPTFSKLREMGRAVSPVPPDLPEGAAEEESQPEADFARKRQPPPHRRRRLPAEDAWDNAWQNTIPWDASPTSMPIRGQRRKQRDEQFPKLRPASPTQEPAPVETAVSKQALTEQQPVPQPETAANGAPEENESPEPSPQEGQKSPGAEKEDWPSLPQPDQKSPESGSEAGPEPESESKAKSPSPPAGGRKGLLSQWIFGAKKEDSVELEPIVQEESLERFDVHAQDGPEDAQEKPLVDEGVDKRRQSGDDVELSTLPAPTPPRFPVSRKRAAGDLLGKEVQPNFGEVPQAGSHGAEMPSTVGDVPSQEADAAAAEKQTAGKRSIPLPTQPERRPYLTSRTKIARPSLGTPAKPAMARETEESKDNIATPRSKLPAPSQRTPISRHGLNKENEDLLSRRRIGALPRLQTDKQANNSSPANGVKSSRLEQLAAPKVKRPSPEERDLEKRKAPTKPVLVSRTKRTSLGPSYPQDVASPAQHVRRPSMPEEEPPVKRKVNADATPPGESQPPVSQENVEIMPEKPTPEQVPHETLPDEANQEKAMKQEDDFQTRSRSREHDEKSHQHAVEPEIPHMNDAQKTEHQRHKSPLELHVERFNLAYGKPQEDKDTTRTKGDDDRSLNVPPQREAAARGAMDDPTERMHKDRRPRYRSTVDKQTALGEPADPKSIGTNVTQPERRSGRSSPERVQKAASKETDNKKLRAERNDAKEDERAVPPEQEPGPKGADEPAQTSTRRWKSKEGSRASELPSSIDEDRAARLREHMNRKLERHQQRLSRAAAERPPTRERHDVPDATIRQVKEEGHIAPSRSRSLRRHEDTRRQTAEKSRAKSKRDSHVEPPEGREEKIARRLLAKSLRHPEQLEKNVYRQPEEQSGERESKSSRPSSSRKQPEQKAGETEQHPSDTPQNEDIERKSQEALDTSEEQKPTDEQEAPDDRPEHKPDQPSTGLLGGLWGLVGIGGKARSTKQPQEVDANDANNAATETEQNDASNGDENQVNDQNREVPRSGQDPENDAPNEELNEPGQGQKTNDVKDPPSDVPVANVTDEVPIRRRRHSVQRTDENARPRSRKQRSDVPERKEVKPTSSPGPKESHKLGSLPTAGVKGEVAGDPPRPGEAAASQPQQTSKQQETNAPASSREHKAKHSRDNTVPQDPTRVPPVVEGEKGGVRRKKSHNPARQSPHVQPRYKTQTGETNRRQSQPPAKDENHRGRKRTTVPMQEHDVYPDRYSPRSRSVSTWERSEAGSEVEEEPRVQTQQHRYAPNGHASRKPNGAQAYYPPQVDGEDEWDEDDAQPPYDQQQARAQHRRERDPLARGNSTRKRAPGYARDPDDVLYDDPSSDDGRAPTHPRRQPSRRHREKDQGQLTDARDTKPARKPKRSRRPKPPEDNDEDDMDEEEPHEPLPEQDMPEESADDEAIEEERQRELRKAYKSGKQPKRHRSRREAHGRPPPEQYEEESPDFGDYAAARERRHEPRRHRSTRERRPSRNFEEMEDRQPPPIRRSATAPTGTKMTGLLGSLWNAVRRPKMDEPLPTRELDAEEPEQAYLPRRDSRRYSQDRKMRRSNTDVEAAPPARDTERGILDEDARRAERRARRREERSRQQEEERLRQEEEELDNEDAEEAEAEMAGDAQQAAIEEEEARRTAERRAKKRALKAKQIEEEEMARRQEEKERRRAEKAAQREYRQHGEEEHRPRDHGKRRARSAGNVEDPESGRVRRHRSHRRPSTDGEGENRQRRRHHRRNPADPEAGVQQPRRSTDDREKPKSRLLRTPSFPSKANKKNEKIASWVNSQDTDPPDPPPVVNTVVDLPGEDGHTISSDEEVRKEMRRRARRRQKYPNMTDDEIEEYRAQRRADRERRRNGDGPGYQSDGLGVRVGKWFKKFAR